MFLTIHRLAQAVFSIHPNEAEVSLENGQCNIAPAQLKALKKRAARLLWNAYEDSFSHFPIDRSKLIHDTVGLLLTKDALRNVLKKESGATSDDHNNLREGFKQTMISPEDAIERGLATAMVPLNPICPKDYDWAGSEVYNGISSCEEVVDLINRDRQTPAVMYSANMKADEAERYLIDPASASVYMQYTNNGPMQCKSGKGFTDSFHVLKISKFGGNLKFAMRIYHGHNWSSWTLLKGCDDDKGKRYEAADMILDFGMRVFVPVNVEADGNIEERTIVLGIISAAASGSLASRLPVSVTSRRWFAGELAKKIFLEAKEKGWKVTAFD